MRIAVDHHGEVGVRTGRILLGEREVMTLGVVDRDPNSKEERMVRADDLAEFDVVVSDAEGEAAGELVERCLDAETSCVLWTDGDAIAAARGGEFAAVHRTLVTGSNVAAGLAPALATHEQIGGGEVLETTIAWTEPGRQLRRGEPIAFPDPVGALWASERVGQSGFRAFAATTPGEWAGAVARVTTASPNGVITRIVGVSDLAPHLEALSLAAGALVVDGLASGAHRPAAAASRYLDRAIRAGLDIASYTLEGSL